jgi:hypothetical protein
VVSLQVLDQQGAVGAIEGFVDIPSLQDGAYSTHLGDGGGWLTGSSSFQPRRAVGTVFGAK